MEDRVDKSINWNYLGRNKPVDIDTVKAVERHVKKYGLTGDICAYYSDMEDFFSDWCGHCGCTRTEARKLLHGGKGEFQVIKEYGIIRYTI